MRSRVRKSLSKSKSTGSSSLSLLIVVFGICVWIAQVFATTAFSDCQLGLFWTSDWFEYGSLFQICALAFCLLGLLWLLKACSGSARKRAAETVAQGVLLLALAVWMISLKAYLFPFASPTKSQVDAVVDYLHPPPFALEGERDAFAVSHSDAPEVEFTENPRWDPRINKRLPEIFTGRYSPTVADMERLKACVAEQNRAAVQWEKDRKTLEDFEREQERSVKPSRPSDWREDLDP